ncbi:obscurin-like protein 1 isoform X1 [Brienomyrus brachyistius]|uniref:obscurin-like protein 1 isoform X1 n=2 Tax=Brienomyrus brachyistius TaxID=42636 RepID=UPI0020B3999C|nr:obscurin-like protein 1 isoform X1 [Brienomyrus brachyistius]XP_048884342.1 obscurin-like protein 1 isoform X1 [Brienomyrus brachyistius]
MDAFAGAPRIRSYPRPVTVCGGSDAILTCCISGDPHPEVVWERNGERIPMGGHFCPTENGDVYSLTISATTPEDAGQYICKIKNSVGEAYAAATLRVEGIADNRDTSLKGRGKMEGIGLTREDDDITMKEGGKMEGMRLTMENLDSTLNLESKLMHERLPEDNLAVIQNMEGKEQERRLTMNNEDTKINAEGRQSPLDFNGYTPLKVEDKIEQRRQPTESEAGRVANGYAPLNVEEVECAPRVLIRPLSARVRLGDDATLSCKLWGHPLPEVTWEKDGQRLNEIFDSAHYSEGSQDGGWVQLCIFGVRGPDGGVYTCRARNTAGQVLASAMLLVDRLDLEEDAVQNGYGHWEGRGRYHIPPLRDDPSLNPSKVKKFAVTEGKHAKFRCYVTGKPKPDIIWRKDGWAIRSGRRHLLYEDREGYFTLKVLYCKQQDIGTYVCAASNMAGHTLSAVHLYVKEPRGHFQQPLQDVEACERDLAVLECEVADDSAPVTWYLEDRRLQASVKYGMEEWGKRRRLTIRDVGADDDGVYLCETADGSRSIAELAIRGTITRRLPRRLEVLEGENAAFCVEVAEDEMDSKWHKDGLQLWDTHRTIIKSFGKTHILVFVDTMLQDSGIVTFTVGRSRTTAKLRVKAARHAPPSCPSDAQICENCANVALLSWVPVQDVVKGSPLGYVVEQQEVGSQEWLQCLTTDGATSAEVLGDNMPREADYRFRVCSMNKYGRSSHVEFPSTVHLVPVLRVEKPLQDVLVRRGHEAHFIIQLSASATGSWFWNGTKVEDNGQFSTQQSGTCHSLLIQGVELCDDRTEVTFVATGIRESAFLLLQAPAMFTPLLKMDSHKRVELGQPIVLYCELSDPTVPVHWSKDGADLNTKNGFLVQSVGNMRRIIIESAEFLHSGAYTCDSGDDVITFNIEVEAPPPRFVELPEIQKNPSVKTGDPIILQCAVTDPTEQVCWSKDGVKLFTHTGLNIQSEGTVKQLTVQSADLSHSGIYSCSLGDDVITFNVNVQEPPVTFMDMPEEDHHRRIVELDPLFLSCEVSRSDAEVSWYKDGMEKHHGDNNIIIQASGTTRRLIIQSTQSSDSGTYTCCSGDEEVLFTVQIREPPVMIVHPKEDIHLELNLSEEVVLSCELSHSSSVVHWYKDGQKLQEGDRFKLKSEGPYRTLTIPHSTIEDSGEYMCDTADDSAFFQLSITEAPVYIVSPNQSHVELCGWALEQVVLSCEISKAEAEVRWFRDGLQLEDMDGLFLEVDGLHRRLIIPAATTEDSADYICETTGDSVTFTVIVTEAPVKFVHLREMPQPTEALAGEPLVLRCEVSHPEAPVSWIRDSGEIKVGDEIEITEDGVFRQITILSPTVADSGKYICQTKDDKMEFQVKITEPPVKILRKEEINTELKTLVSDDLVLECELSRASGNVMWYKDGKRIIKNERFCYEEEGSFRSLIILSAEFTDAGEYICDAGDDRVVFNVTMKEAPVTITGNSISQQQQCLVAGDDLILACEVSHPDAPVQWYCNDSVLSSDSRTCVESYGTVRRLIILGLQPSDSGRYTCDAIDDKMYTTVKVQVPPVQFLNKNEGNVLVGYEGESIMLNAQVSQDNSTVCWMRDWTNVAGERFHLSSEGSHRILTIDPLQRSDSGEYTCDADTDRMHFSLLVKEMRVKFVKALEDTLAHQNGLVTLRCELNKLRGDVLWLKDDVEIVPSRRYTIRANGPERTLTIHRLMPADAGEYACESKDDRTCGRLVVKMPRVVEFLVELHNTTVMEGEDATFRCVVSPEDVQLLWYWDDEMIANTDGRISVSRNGLCHMLHIHGCQLTDGGRIVVEAEGVVSKAYLQVQEAQVLFTKKMASVVSEEYGVATLEVEVNLEAAEVQWMRQGLVIQPGPKYTLNSEGHRRSLTVHSLGISDRGTYCCETLHDRTQGKLNVESRKITISRGLTDMEVLERETATFEVELSHSNVEGVWQKDGLRLKPSHQLRITSKGQVHSLTLSSLTLEDTGTVVFSAEGVRSLARLTVKEPPVTFLKEPQDLCLPEGSLASIECELSRQNARVRWLKDSVELKPGKSHRIYSMGRKRLLQILECDVCDSGTYECDAGDARASCSMDIYEREVEVLQDLVNLEIQEDQNAVFVCEVSRADVPGEWFRNEEKIRPTSMIKIRQEGNKHFLLMCNVMSEDSGEIRFAARGAESIAYLEVNELPVTIVKPLRDRTALERHRVILECTVSSPRATVHWFQGVNEIVSLERFTIHSEGCYHKLVIQPLVQEDEGTYSVQVGEHTSSAQLLVEAQALLILRELEDVEVTAPNKARFECELSVPAARPPLWSLNEETLQPGPQVFLESLGTVYRLTLRNTSPDMQGLIKFTVGKARSCAKLSVNGD